MYFCVPTERENVSTEYCLWRQISLQTVRQENYFCLEKFIQSQSLFLLHHLLLSLYFLCFKKVGTLDWARPFPADASSTSRANEGPASSALPWPMAYRPWALAELTRRRPFVDTRRLVVIRRKLPSYRVTVDGGEAFLLF